MKNTDIAHLPEGFRKFTLKSYTDDIDLSIMSAIPNKDKEPVGIIQIVHGMCEHKERYIPFMKHLTDGGYICVIHDHRGHGSSVKTNNDLGYFYEGGYNSMIEEIGIVNAWARNEYPNLPLVLLGHSMGSMAVRSFVKRHDELTDGLIVCGSPSRNPAAGIGKLIASADAKLFGDRHRPAILQKMSFGMFNRPFKHEGSPNAWICSDKEIVKEYDNNPLCTYQFTSNGFHNLFSLMVETYSKKGWQMHNTAMPIMFISGADDPCAAGKENFLSAVQSMKDVGYTDIKWNFYEGMRHEILNEKRRSIVWNDVVSFANKVTSSRSEITSKL